MIGFFQQGGFGLDGFTVPKTKEFLHALAAVAFALFERFRLLNMDGLSLTVEHDEGGVAEAAGITEEAHGFLVFVALGVVDMDIDEVLLDEGSYDAVLFCEVGETEAPRAPVAAHLAQHVPIGFFSQCGGFLDLLHGVEPFVIHIHLGLTYEGNSRKGKK